MKREKMGNWFSGRVINWYSKHKRDLPWRKTKDPYKIWLSEIILQQTRVEQGLPYYERFVQTFPKVEMLAEASEDEVLRLWQGLGYYSRARNLQAAAKFIMNDLGGIFPSDFKSILELKGVGTYTAAAIASFAFGESVPVVDGNVYRVLSRIFNDNTDISSGKGQKHFFALAEELIDAERPADFNQAIMEFGALYCTPKSPACESCIFNDKCEALANQKITELPYKKAKVKVKPRFLHYFILKNAGTICLLKRDESSIWKGLYEFPNLFFDKEEEFDLEQANVYLTNFGVEDPQLTALGGRRKHQLSHISMQAQFYEVEIKKLSKKLTPLFYKIEELKQLPKPVLVDRILQEYYF